MTKYYAIHTACSRGASISVLSIPEEILSTQPSPAVIFSCDSYNIWWHFPEYKQIIHFNYISACAKSQQHSEVLGGSFFFFFALLCKHDIKIIYI